MLITQIHGTLFGGTWVSWGAGKVPVGVDSSDSNFNTVEKTGGSSTIDLSHSHTVNSHTHDLSTGKALIGRSSTSLNTIAYKNAGSVSGTTYDRRLSSALGIEAISENISDTSALSGNSGGATPGTNSKLSSSQSVLQPYITCYMWKRTA